MCKMNDLRIKFIQRSPEGVRLRLKLFDFYFDDEAGDNIPRIKDIVDNINSYIALKEKDSLVSKKYISEA
jgi:hypothetical protein